MINTGKEMARELVSFFNNMTFDRKGFVAGILDSHRTLQQIVFSVFMDCVVKWAEDAVDGRYDLRNEATVLKSKKIMDALGEDTYIPYI